MPGGFDPPQEVINSWPEPNFTNPDTHKTELTAGIITVTVASSIVLLLRMYSRLIVVRSAGLDDLLIVVAQVWLDEEGFCSHVASYANHRCS